MSLTREELAKKLGVPGTRVRIRMDSEFAHQSYEVGVVLEKSGPGWVRVVFPDHQNSYRTGGSEGGLFSEEGICDLELAPEPPTQEFIKEVENIVNAVIKGA
jgi:hypothetical protein